MELTLQKLEVTGGFFVPVELHDRKTYNFLLDTGATHTVIYAGRIGYTIPDEWYGTGKLEATTHFGRYLMNCVDNFSMIIGGKAIHVPMVAINEEKTTLPIAGVLGLDVLEKHKAIISYPKKGVCTLLLCNV